MLSLDTIRQLPVEMAGSGLESRSKTCQAGTRYSSGVMQPKMYGVCSADAIKASSKIATPVKPTDRLY